MAITLSCGQRTLHATEGETLLSVMLRGGLPAQYVCEQGNCGTCRVALVQGDVLEMPHSEFALPGTERARGIVLACRTQMWGDAEIGLLDAEDFRVHPQHAMRCRVVDLADLTHDIRRVRMAVESGGPLEFSAGQYAQLWLGDLAPRDYSMANAPGEPYLEFHVRFVPQGASSRYVFERLHLGDVIRVDGPKGTAFLRDSSTAPILAVAGGSGLAPIRAIVVNALARGLRQPIHVYVGMRDERDVYLEHELAELSARHGNLKYEYVLSDAPVDASRRRGNVMDAVIADCASFSGWKAYLAGPPVMVEAACRLLMERGVARQDVHADAFYTAADKPGGLGR